MCRVSSRAPRVYVLHGKARVILGDRDLVVEAGQAAEFDTRIPHGVAALGNEPLEMLAIFNRSGERIHLPGISERYDLPE